MGKRSAETTCEKQTLQEGRTEQGCGIVSLAESARGGQKLGFKGGAVKALWKGAQKGVKAGGKARSVQKDLHAEQLARASEFAGLPGGRTQCKEAEKGGERKK